MKKQFLLLLSLSYSILVVAQPAFNKKELFQFGSNIFSNLIVHNNKLYVSGLAQRISQPNTNVGGFGVLNSEGDSLLSVSFLDTLNNPVWWDNCMIFTKNSEIVIAAKTQEQNIVMKLDTNGQLLNHRYNYSYFDTVTRKPSPCLLYQDSDSLIWIISTDGNLMCQNYLQITKLTPSFDSLFKVITGDITFANKAKFFTEISKNRFLIAGRYNIVKPNYTIDQGDFFIEVDRNGKVLSKYYTDNYDLGGMGGMYYEKSDSSYVMFGSTIIEISPCGNGAPFAYYYPMVYKLNNKKKLIWKTKMGNGAYSLYNFMYKIKEANEQDGYVFSGALRAPNLDSSGQQQVYGTFGKVSKKGDSLWLRQYRAFDKGVIKGAIYDIQPAPDGGYYLAGSTIGGPKPEHQYEGGWILKVDQYGCLVPNCHLSTALPTLPNTEIHYSIYPNPTTDRVNVFVKDAETRLLDLKLYNNNGQLLKSVEHSGEVNYMLSLESYPSGVYFLNFLQEGRLLHSEKIVKQ